MLQKVIRDLRLTHSVVDDERVFYGPEPEGCSYNRARDVSFIGRRRGLWRAWVVEF